MTPQSAKANWRREDREPRNLHGKYKRQFKLYRQAKSLEDYIEQRLVKHSGHYDYDCWQFMTAKDKDGYPQVTGSRHCADIGLTRAHQAVYHLYKGSIPDGMLVCHTCDHPWCVNPDHLFLGTPDDNVQDMIHKGRYVHPTEYGKVMKITKEQKQEILLRKGKQRSQDVADEFGISFSRVCQIWRGE